MRGQSVPFSQLPRGFPGEVGVDALRLDQPCELCQLPFGVRLQLGALLVAYLLAAVAIAVGLSSLIGRF